MNKILKSIILSNFFIIFLLPFSDRVNNMDFSSILKLEDSIKVLQAQGEIILKLSAGQPYISTPENVVTSAIKALKDNKIYYAHSRGVFELRKAIIDSYNKNYNLNLDPDKNILITPGAKQGILYTVLSLVNQGDEVIIPTPAWVSYSEIVKLAQAKPVFVKTNKNFDLDFESIKQSITSKTKLIILNSPNNPTGRIIDKKVLKEINDFCVDRGIYILADEIYSQLVFDQNRNTSILEIDKNLTNIILLDGFSKAYSMMGWRLGYLIAAPELINQMLKIQQNSATSPTTFAQWGAIEAINSGKEFVDSALKIYQENKDYLVSEFKKLNKFDLVIPQGAIYGFINISKVNNDSEKFCMDFLDNFKIAVVPGIAFGDQGQGYIRICLATDRSNLELFINKLKEL
ncbi:MAG: pyridoxal phosphate-dependent aminotransferase [bacterium]